MRLTFNFTKKPVLSIGHRLRRAFSRAVFDIKTKKKRGIVLLVLVGLSGWMWGVNAAALWFLFLSFLFYGWENRIIGILALVNLATCPILIALNQNVRAEAMAVYAYYFLVMTVALQIVEYYHDQSAEKKKNA